MKYFEFYLMDNRIKIQGVQSRVKHTRQVRGWWESNSYINRKENEGQWSTRSSVLQSVTLNSRTIVLLPSWLLSLPPWLPLLTRSTGILIDIILILQNLEKTEPEPGGSWNSTLLETGLVMPQSWLLKFSPHHSENERKRIGSEPPKTKSSA